MLRFLFDGPPGPESGRLVEVEDEQGRSVAAGAWTHDEARRLWYLDVSYDELESAASALAQDHGAFSLHFSPSQDKGKPSWTLEMARSFTRKPLALADFRALDAVRAALKTLGG